MNACVRTLRLLWVILSLPIGAPLAQSPSVEKVEPPNWWAGHSIDPVRLVMRGKNLTGARAACGRLACGRVTVNASGTYAFVDVTIPKTAKAGDYPIALRTASGSTRAPFTISPPL